MNKNGVPIRLDVSKDGTTLQVRVGQSKPLALSPQDCIEIGSYLVGAGYKLRAIAALRTLMHAGQQDDTVIEDAIREYSKFYSS